MNLKAYAGVGCTRVDKISSRVGSEEIADCRITLKLPLTSLSGSKLTKTGRRARPRYGSPASKRKRPPYHSTPTFGANCRRHLSAPDIRHRPLYLGVTYIKNIYIFKLLTINENSKGAPKGQHSKSIDLYKQPAKRDRAAPYSFPTRRLPSH